MRAGPGPVGSTPANRQTFPLTAQVAIICQPASLSPPMRLLLSAGKKDGHAKITSLRPFKEQYFQYAYPTHEWLRDNRQCRFP